MIGGISTFKYTIGAYLIMHYFNSVVKLTLRENFWHHYHQQQQQKSTTRRKKNTKRNQKQAVCGNIAYHSIVSV